jgi:hypothetical protein
MTKPIPNAGPTGRDLSEADREALIALLPTKLGNRGIAEKIGCAPSLVQYYRNKVARQAKGISTKYDPSSDKRVYETEAQTEAFANAMAGMTFANNVHTKSYGKQHHREPAHVMTESNLARCG